jgi:hypothetical protein
MCILASNYIRTGKGTLLLCFAKHHAMKLSGGGEGAGVILLRIPKLVLLWKLVVILTNLVPIT